MQPSVHGDGAVNDQQVAVEDARSPHGIAGDADVKRRGGVADEMLVEVEACLPGNRRQAKGNRRTRERMPAAAPASAAKLGGRKDNVVASSMAASPRNRCRHCDRMSIRMQMFFAPIPM